MHLVKTSRGGVAQVVRVWQADTTGFKFTSKPRAKIFAPSREFAYIRPSLWLRIIFASKENLPRRFANNFINRGVYSRNGK